MSEDTRRMKKRLGEKQKPFRSRGKGGDMESLNQARLASLMERKPCYLVRSLSHILATGQTSVIERMCACVCVCRERPVQGMAWYGMVWHGMGLPLPGHNVDLDETERGKSSASPSLEARRSLEGTLHPGLAQPSVAKRHPSPLKNLDHRPFSKKILRSAAWETESKGEQFVARGRRVRLSTRSTGPRQHCHPKPGAHKERKGQDEMWM
ncbi:hypothetical protein LZ30DRAFT_177548 [Colletotrichum cereale]|nr:hypothetical protein LZ30DRAFT_177548 [Colletotrichum cereale]